MFSICFHLVHFRRRKRIRLSDGCRTVWMACIGVIIFNLREWNTLLADGE